MAIRKDCDHPLELSDSSAKHPLPKHPYLVAHVVLAGALSIASPNPARLSSIVVFVGAVAILHILKIENIGIWFR